MPNFSRNAQENINATSGEMPLVLLEINHAALAEPIRVVNDNQDLTSNGNLYIALPFNITLPDDFSEQIPRATLAIDNIGRELTQWLEASAGARGATVTVRLAMRDTPNVYEMELTMGLNNIAIDWLTVSGSLGYEDILNRPAVALTYRRDTAPGLFA